MEDLDPSAAQVFDTLVLDALRRLPFAAAAGRLRRALRSDGVYCECADVRRSLLRLASQEQIEPIREYGDLVPRWRPATKLPLPN
jgi:hypothetical protein